MLEACCWMDLRRMGNDSGCRRSTSMLSGVSWGHSGETGHTQMVMGKDSQQTQRIQHDALHGTDPRRSQLLQHDVALQ